MVSKGTKPVDTPVNYEIWLYFNMEKNPKNLLYIVFTNKHIVISKKGKDDSK